MVHQLEVFDLFGKILNESLSGVKVRLAVFVEIDSLLVPCCDSNVIGGSDVDLVDRDDSDWRLMFAFHGRIGPSPHVVAASTCVL